MRGARSGVGLVPSRVGGGGQQGIDLAPDSRNLACGLVPVDDSLGRGRVNDGNGFVEVCLYFFNVLLLDVLFEFLQGGS